MARQARVTPTKSKVKTFKADRFVITPVIGVYESGEKIDEIIPQNPTIVFGMQGLKKFPQSFEKVLKEIAEQDNNE